MGFIVKAVKSVVKAVVGVVSKVVGAVFGFAVGSKTTAKAKATNTLNKSLEPEAYRKIVFGRMASPLDLRFWEVWAANGSRYDEVLASAAHRINAYLELYMENDLAISAAGVVQAKFAGVLSRDTRLGAPGQTAMAVGSGTQWTNTATFDGVPHIKLAWVPDEKKLPNGIPSRYTQVVEGALVYDPRRDSTVPGGAGPHRANDRSTWSYATLDGNGVPIGRNNALQALWYLLGWTVPTKNAAGQVTGEMLVAGRGVDPQDINLASFIAGANACEVAGYYTDMVLSTEDTHTSNEDKITCSGLIGRLIDPGGLWSYYANVDDTANIAVELTDADIIQGVTVNWNEYESMSSQFNQVSGKFVNPSPTTLFQAFPYPMVRDATYEANLGIKRRKPQDFEQVLDGVLAQRLARLLLNQGQYQGEFQAGFNYRALKAQAWSVVRYTSERFGFTKLFRVYRHDISTDAGIGMLLKEIDPSIWGAGTVNPPLAPGLGTNYQANQEIPLAGLAVASTIVKSDATNSTVYDAGAVTWDEPPVVVRRTEVRYRVAGSTYWESAAPVQRGGLRQALIFPLVKSTAYEVQARHISINEVEGPWLALAGNFVSGSSGNVDYQGILTSGTTAQWPYVGDPMGTRPENNATVGAPAGTNVAGVPAATLVGNVSNNAAAISNQGLRIDQIIVDVDDLQNVYGDTASASASAAAASAAQSAAQTARDAAQQARDLALGYRDAAAGSASTADSARVASLAAQSASETARNQASQSATNASGSQSAAAGSAGEAKTYRDAAGSFSSSAQASSVSAKLQAAAILPSTLINKGAYFTSAGYGYSPEAAPDISPLIGDSVYGPYYSEAGQGFGGHMGTRGVVRYEVGKTYDIEARVWTAQVGSDTPAAIIWVTPMKADYSLVDSLANAGGLSVGQGAVGVVNTISIMSERYTLPTVAGAVWLRFGVLFNRKNGALGAQAAGAEQRPLSIAVRDATEALAASNSASAASTSASSAATSKTDAGNSATAANQSKVDAQAARDAASGSASAAATSASNASGSATAAGNSASSSTTAKNQAEAARDAASGSANAASGSASSAAGSATTAGQQATAAQGSAQAASTAKGQAEAAQTAAATSATNAAGSASAASTSQTLSASNASNAGLSLSKLFPRVVSPQAYTWGNQGGADLQRNTPLPDAVLVNGAIYLDTNSSLPVNYPYGIWLRAPIQWINGRTYRLISKLQQLSGASSLAAVYAVFFDAFGTYVGEATLHAGIMLDGSLKDYVFDYICGTTLAPANTAYIKLGLVTQRQAGNIAGTQAGITAVHALYLDDVTSQKASEGSASAAASSASSAGTAQTAAGNSASAANQSKLDAQAANGSAQAAASASAGSASTATAQAASATATSILTSRMAQNMLNKNPAFADLGYAYDSNGQPLATDWAYWWSAPTAANKFTGGAASDNRWQMVAANGQNTGISSGLFQMRKGYYVIEAIWELGDGDSTGTRIYVSHQQTGVGEVGGTQYFLSDFIEASGVAVKDSGLTGFRRVRAKRLIYLDLPPNVDSGALVLMLNFGGTMPYKYMWFDFVGIRPANDAERATMTVLPSLQASVSSNSAAVTTLQGRALAYWQQVVNAGAAGAFIEARAEASYGAGATSSVSIGAREVHIYNQVATLYQKALSIQSGNVIIYGNLTAAGGIFLGNGNIWRVQYQSKYFAASDGQNVAFGADLGNVPKFVFLADNLAPLAANETYKLYADQVSSTGFIPRLRIATPGAATSYNLTNDTVPGGVPTRQIDKAGNPDSPNNVYNLTFSGTVRGYAYNNGTQ